MKKFETKLFSFITDFLSMTAADFGAKNTATGFCQPGASAILGCVIN
ncbi:MAG: hypothetical protein M3384_14180 [Acidobacteriota bacterium]|nr:hypothetical protein [Acidobacteriota bacterium]